MKINDIQRGTHAVLALGHHTLTGAEVVVVRVTFLGAVVVRLVKPVSAYGTEETLHVQPYELQQPTEENHRED